MQLSVTLLILSLGFYCQHYQLLSHLTDQKPPTRLEGKRFAKHNDVPHLHNVHMQHHTLPTGRQWGLNYGQDISKSKNVHF